MYIYLKNYLPQYTKQSPFFHLLIYLGDLFTSEHKNLLLFLVAVEYSIAGIKLNHSFIENH